MNLTRTIIAFALVLWMAPNGVTQPTATSLTPDDLSRGDFYGYSVALDGETALIGAFRDDYPEAVDAGSAYVFTRGDKGWQLQSKLSAPDRSAGDTFGGHVALFGNTAVVGSMRDDDDWNNSGSVHIFERDDGQWTHHQKLTARDGAADAGFGQSVAIFEETLVIGAPRAHQTGAVYVFEQANGKWAQSALLLPDDGAPGDVFGISVAIDKDMMLVGADLNDERATDAGAVYVFVRTEEGWRLETKLMASDGMETDIFGVRVALSGETALISARRDDDEQRGENSGSAYVFVRDGNEWAQEAKLTTPDASAEDQFGRSVAIDGETALIGASFHDERGNNSGAAYLFSRQSWGWELTEKFHPDAALDGDVFGWSVALDGQTGIITAPQRAENGENAGAAFAFEVTLD